ncbi:hypothetical protein [Tahibacter soli]|uniref:Uncharacterized protein n=1 Tax=Tahibacter soli TaxID=2983605 RepID=A0A9X3YIK3_9GAMM|nr:hypothetical protein [Tahibacter soli]MDC8013026.1 hypothetical protein [Tahibacter soli]
MIHYPPEKNYCVNILAIFEKNVGDGEWSFNHLLDAVRNWRGFGYRFVVREHVRLKDKPITEELVEDVDEMWFFGTALCNKPENSLPLSDDEVAVINARMIVGVGVFATGDHEQIGACLCERIPRVDRMRVWRGADAPRQMPPDSYNSNLRSPYRDVIDYKLTTMYGDVETDDSDTSAKQIWTTRDDASGTAHELFQLGYVGTEKQWVRFLPDHMHEGRLRDYSATDDPAIFSQTYPGAPLPRIVAYANRMSFSMGRKGRSLEYPVVSVYESENCEGNIVVDSTFHHWTDSNALRLRFSPTWLHVEQFAINVANWLLGWRGRDKVKKGIIEYIATTSEQRKRLIEDEAIEEVADDIGKVANYMSRQLGEHRIVVDALERILYGNVLSAKNRKNEMELDTRIRAGWPQLKGANLKDLRETGKLPSVILGLTFAGQALPE